MDAVSIAVGYRTDSTNRQVSEEFLAGPKKWKTNGASLSASFPNDHQGPNE